MLAVVAIVAVATMLGASGAGAASGPKPVMECSFHDPDTGLYNSVWGYKNKSGSATIPIGSKNQFDSGPADRGQPTYFSSGDHHNLFVVTHSGTVRWKLNGGSAKAPGKKCSTNPVPIVTPGGGGVIGWVPPALLVAGIAGLASVLHRRGLLAGFPRP